MVTIIFRNDSYGNVARDLTDFLDGTYETDLHNPDFVQFTESFGAVGMRANDPEDLATLIPEALALQRPVVIDVPFSELPIPRAPYIAPSRPPMDPTPRRPHPLLGGLPVMPSRHTTKLSGLALT